MRNIIADAISKGYHKRDKYGINPTLRLLTTACTMAQLIAPVREISIAILLHYLCRTGYIKAEEVVEQFGEEVALPLKGLIQISLLYKKQASVQSENFRNLLLTFAEDIRVILVMIVDRLCIMRMINHHPNRQFVQDKALESIYLYAPLAHRLGLYAIKSELEDMWLKYTDRETYTDIARKLKESKEDREAYIKNFITPVRERLEKEGFKFEIKGRTKSIYSIWNKLKKKNLELHQIYDLFAIRVILDSAPEREKADCWVVYSIIVDMYRSNPQRMKDYITIPKSNGYESLHTTVYGPENRMVEVQIRTKRMDEVAESGFAAHWKYKGGKSEQNLDNWMNNVRGVLETAESGPMELMKGLRMDVYDKEVFVFTPKGDLYKMPLGSTLLDFAFNIHTRLGCTCVGGRVDGTNQKLNYKLKSGDTIEILTQNNQIPKADWLNFVVTSKARNRIKQTLNEMQNRYADLGRETLERRFKNRKLTLDERVLTRLIKKMGYKSAIDFMSELGQEKLDVNDIIERYQKFEADEQQQQATISANKFSLDHSHQQNEPDDDVLVIGGDSIKGVNYHLSKCCCPIYGDDIIGFIASDGAIKIHRSDCKNVLHLCAKYPYRKIETKWSGKLGSQFAVNLRIVGQDDIGIVTNISSIINKEDGASLRNISIDSHDGLFQGFLVIGISDRQSLAGLIRKLKTVKGVKDVERQS